MPDKDTLYARWVNGDLSDQELQELRGNGTVDDLERVMAATDDLAMPIYNVDEGYLKLKTRRTTKNTKVHTLNWKWATGLAAGLALIFFAKVIFFSSNSSMILAQNGDNQAVNLEDGSTILINDGSSITYQTEDWQSNRNVLLNGEALFDVEKGSPFTVTTDNGIIKVLGTQFNVRSWGSKIYVECYEGKVQVLVDGQQEILTQNESVNVVNGQMNNKKTINNSGPLWTKGVSRFYEEEITEVFAELERQFDIKVQSEPINQLFSGNFQHASLETALRSICKPLGIKYTISKNNKKVLIEKE